jgi:pyruvyltransferase
MNQQQSIKAYWWSAKNFGDVLTPIILEWLTGKKVELASRKDSGKILAVGSVMAALKENDIVWGTGWHKHKMVTAPKGATFLAVRGPLTRKLIKGNVPEVYGDPALLLPKIYFPSVKKTHKVGLIPHYVEKPLLKATKGEKMIDIQADWKKVIEDILSCEMIISSSLHGIICAEAFGIPTAWVQVSKKIIGKGLKFNDYFLATGRKWQWASTPYKPVYLPPVNNLEKIQKILLEKAEYIKKISSDIPTR